MTEKTENPSLNIIQARMKRDPAVGSSVLLAFTPDNMVSIFLGLATLLLP